MTLTIEGEVDEHGWVFPFGGFKAIRGLLEYYFDHTSLVGADDPRLPDIIALNEKTKLFNLRVLPHGVSMEMSSVFIWSLVQPYVFMLTSGRCSVTEVESREHENNASSFSVSKDEAAGFFLAISNISMNQFQEKLKEFTPEQIEDRANRALVKEPYWDFADPQETNGFLKDVIIAGIPLVHQ